MSCECLGGSWEVRWTLIKSLCPAFFDGVIFFFLCAYWYSKLSVVLCQQQKLEHKWTEFSVLELNEVIDMPGSCARDNLPYVISSSHNYCNYNTSLAKTWLTLLSTLFLLTYVFVNTCILVFIYLWFYLCKWLHSWQISRSFIWCIKFSLIY